MQGQVKTSAASRAHLEHACSAQDLSLDSILRCAPSSACARPMLMNMAAEQVNSGQLEAHVLDGVWGWRSASLCRWGSCGPPPRRANSPPLQFWRIWETAREVVTGGRGGEQWLYARQEAQRSVAWMLASGSSAAQQTSFLPGHRVGTPEHPPFHVSGSSFSQLSDMYYQGQHSKARTLIFRLRGRRRARCAAAGRCPHCPVTAPTCQLDPCQNLIKMMTTQQHARPNHRSPKHACPQIPSPLTPNHQAAAVVQHPPGHSAMNAPACS